MKHYLLILALPFCLSCAESPAEAATGVEDETETVQSTPDYSVALKFINDYVQATNSGDDLDTWLKNRTDVTKSFIDELHRILDEAEKADPEMGLGFDAILDAQDMPESFEIEREDGNYLIVRGTEWPDFQVILKLELVNDQWMVDGSGIVNIPEDRLLNR